MFNLTVSKQSKGKEEKKNKQECTARKYSKGRAKKPVRD